jgi:hypothetical protein
LKVGDVGKRGTWANKSFIGIFAALILSVFSTSSADAWWSLSPSSQIQSSHEQISKAGIALIRDKLTNEYLINNLDAIDGYTYTITYDMQAHGDDGERNGGDIPGYWNLFRALSNHNLYESANSYLGRCIHLIEDMSVPAHAYNIKHGGLILDKFEIGGSTVSPEVSGVQISDPDASHVDNPTRYYDETRLNTKNAVVSRGYADNYHTGDHGGEYANWKGDGFKGYYTVESGIENELLDFDLFPLGGGQVFVQYQMNEAAKDVAKFLLAVDKHLQDSAGTDRALYFPHVDTSLPWQTEIAIINTSDQPVTGTLMGISNAGRLAETKPVTLSAHGRRQITIADEFTNHIDIAYIIFDTASTEVQGYTKFYQAGKYRAAIPAIKEVNTSDIYISHIDSGARWWTGVSLVNTTSAAKNVTITFNNGQSRSITLAANEHQAFMIEPQPDIKSAVITNASGVIGLELFGNIDGSDHLEGILLTDKTVSTLYYPHVDNYGWWTGIVAYNPSASACTITITPYSAQGTPLAPSTHSIAGKGKYVGIVSELDLSTDTAWIKIDSTQPLCGFELFGTLDENQLAAYAGGSGPAKAGVFAKIEKNGWTGIAFVNTEADDGSVTLTAYNDSGSVVANWAIAVGGHAKVVNYAEVLFSQDLSGATYFTYSSDRNVVGFQLNGTSDGMMLDGLPALGGAN